MLPKSKNAGARSIEPLVMRLLTAWTFSSLIFAVLGGAFGRLERYARFGLVSFAAVFAACFVLQLVIAVLPPMKQRAPERALLPAGFALYSALTAFMTDNWYYIFVLAALWAVLIHYYLQRGWFTPKKPFTKKKMIAVAAIAGGVYVLAVGAASVMRYAANRAPNYDFGIFCQMFYNMRRSFAPVTTCERDRLLSHFAIHLSPIYYLLLPVYFVFPSPATLQLSQAVILGSAVLPLALLCRQKGLSYAKTAAFCVILMCFPAVAAGTNYDLHENCFLLPLLLWSFYFFEKEKYLPMAAFVLLTLLVKEDAAIYIAFFAVFVLLDRKKYLTGSLLLVGAGVYFLAAVAVLSSYGEGIMSTRYENFIVGGGSLLEAVKNVLVNPGYAFLQIFKDGEGAPTSKILFLLQMSVPLAFLPFGVRRPSRLLLLLPMLLMNFLTLYVYQYDVGFQYVFGTIAFLFYLSVLNVSEMSPKTSGLLLRIALAAGALCFILGPLGRLSYYMDIVTDEAQDLKVINAALEEIPEDKSVACTTFLLPRLSARETVYETYYHVPAEGERLDYVILDVRFGEAKDLEKYEELGYKLTKTVKNGDKELLLILEP